MMMGGGERMAQRGGYAAAVRGGGNNQGEPQQSLLSSPYLSFSMLQGEDRISKRRAPNALKLKWFVKIGIRRESTDITDQL